VDVPAGTFNGCVKVRCVGAGRNNQGVYQTTWFAPSVGQVKAVLHTGTDMTLQLGFFTK
jgi:hypothetical protein